MATTGLNTPLAEQFGIDSRFFAFTFKAHRLPPIQACVRVSNAFRQCALAAYQTVTGSRESFLLSGHGGDGEPDQEHRHAYYLPISDGRTLINGLVVALPEARYVDDELRALKLIRAIRWNGPNTHLSVEMVGDADDAVRQIASNWTTVTPYVPLKRYWGTHGKWHLSPDRQLAAEFESRIGVRCEVQGVTAVRERVFVRVGSRSRNGPLPVPTRCAFGVRIRTAEPIRGPLVLGHSAHFGLGQFVPDRSG